MIRSQNSIDTLVNNFANFTPVPAIEDLSEYAKIWNNSSRKMILVGVNEPNAISETTLKNLAEDESVVVMTETTSNLHHPTFINNIDTIITPFTTADFEDFKPEILVTLAV